MNPNEFAETIKAKYPQYKDVDNLTLATKMVEKYPAYSSKVNFNQRVSAESIITSLSKKAVPGSETAVMPAQPADGGTRIQDIPKIIPNALGDIWNLVKEGTYGTAKKLVYDIPKEAIGLLKEQGLGGALKNTTTSLPSAVGSVASALVPQSAKELANTNALAEIPSQFQALVKQNKGSYANALLAAIKSIPEGVPDAVLNYANQIDRSRQAVENHPVNEFLGYLGLKSLASIKSSQSTQKNLPSSGTDFNRAIEAGEVPLGAVYKTKLGQLQPQQATHAVSDLAGKLDMFKKGLGAEFKKVVDMSNPTPTNLSTQASNFLSQSQIKNVVPSAIASFKKGSFKPEIANLFETEGIKPPVSAITSNMAIRGAEAIASKGLFGGQIRDIAIKAIAEVEKRTNQIVERIKPGKTLSDESLGKTLQEGLKEYEDNFKVTEEKIYREFEKTYGKSNVYGMNTKNALQTLIKEQGNDYFAGVDRRLTTMLEKLSGTKNPELKALEENINQFKSKAGGKVPPELEKEYRAKLAELDKTLTFSELKSTRSSIGEAMQKEPQNTAIKRLYGALSEDMKTAVGDVIKNDPLIDNSAKQAKLALDKLNGAYQTGKVKIESNIAQSIGKSNPESIAKNIIKRNSAETIKLVKEMVGEKRFGEVQQSFMRQLFEESVTREKFDVSKLKKKLAEYDQATLDELLSKEQSTKLNEAITELEKFSTMSDALKSGAKMAEGSQTAFLAKVGVIPGLIFSGQFAWAAGILLGDFALKSLFTSGFGRKLLTEGLTAPNLKTLKNLKTLSPEKKQLIIQSFRTQANEDKNK